MGSINEAAAMQSSIALLQERFKQLQRMKEKREQHQLVLLKRLQQEREEPKRLACSCACESPSGLLFFHFLPAAAVPHPGHCLRGGAFECMESPFFATFSPAVSETTCFLTPSLNIFHDWDLDDDHNVDTSLHL
ncbi:hypothetical protein HRI_002995000 [Hibiscus trionum]|uniref:Uncharacterized protein n=1 Tax=Hibiscus trionum TaxID=183268 RepID=A0A9W7M7Q2_HIBTR|nr:hypothetical protein HRI_002995000 [Hibiscus trionum]